MSDTSTPTGRVAEFLRQNERGTGRDQENIIGLWTDPDAEMVHLTVSDLEEILDELEEHRSAAQWRATYTEDRIAEQGVRFIDSNGGTIAGFRGGLEIEIATGSEKTEYVRVHVLDATGGIEISSPRRLAVHPRVENVVDVVTR